MALAIFDLDNTLLGGDSDHAWGDFIAEHKLVDEAYLAKNDQFYRDYEEGNLNILEYLEFCLTPLTQHPLDKLNQLRQQFMDEKVMPMVLEQGKALLQKHRDNGDYLLIITATNLFITGPIAEYLGVDDIIATEPEMVNGEYTGKISGTPSFQEGKITRLNEWLEQNPHSLDGSYFYSDSHNDLPLLKIVENPVVVDGDDKLLQQAKESGWPAISLR